MKRQSIPFFALFAAFALACNVESGEPEAGATDGADAAELPSDESLARTRQGLLGSDACKDVEITVINSRERNGVETGLLVDRVEYHSLSEGAWYTEALDDEVIDFGDSHTWTNQDLQYAENDTIDKWRVHYKYETGHAWSSMVYQEIDTPNDTCHADDNYALTVQ